MNYEEFLEFYQQHGRCPNDVSRSKNKLNEVQLKSRYQKFLKSEEKKIQRKERNIQTAKDNKQEAIDNKDYIDEKWIKVCKLVDERDNNECQLIKLLHYGDLELLEELAGPLIKIKDHAHVIPRSTAPHMKYDVDNLIILNRFSHSMIDQYRDPIEGKQITKEEHEFYWKFIVGKERYNKLLERSKK
jgi:hypothetical protein